MTAFWQKFSGSPYAPALFAGIVCFALYLAGSLTRPILPIDETRYLTVAWEMFSHHEWILPTLNGDSYHHKPPLLFWLIMSVWSLFGVSQGAAMVVPYLIGFAVITLSARLAGRLAPDRPDLPLLTALVTAGSLPFVIYSHLIMFDLLLTVFVLVGVTATLDYARTGDKKHLALFALAIGGGVLAKGPVILLHLLPLALLVRFWKSPNFRPSAKEWTAGVFAAVLGGAIIALAWAVPAAIKGGQEFADKIFWGQTAGRMVKSFDHQHPTWWYLMFAPLFFLPWAFSPAVWGGLRALKGSEALKILGCWMIPVFAGFSLISGKQVHYLLPLLPALSVGMALALDRARQQNKNWNFHAPFAFALLLALIPVLLSAFAQQIESIFPKSPHIGDAFGNMNPLWPIMTSAIVAVSWVAAGRLPHMLRGMLLSLSMILMIVSFLNVARTSFFANYDLMPIAAVLEKNPEAPLAFVRNYHGEFGFLARLDRTVKQLGPQQLTVWLNENPDGIALIRTRKESEYTPYDVLFTQPYKMTNTYAVVVKKGEKHNFVTE
jgi:hypothetical protein